jgi:hypothetical protein
VHGATTEDAWVAECDRYAPESKRYALPLKRRPPMPDPHRRKLTGGHYKDIVAVVRGYAAKVLPPSDTAGTIAIGPVVWEPSGRGRTNWYFVIGSADAAGTFRADGF